MRVTVILLTEGVGVVLAALWIPWLAIPVGASTLVVASWQVQRWKRCGVDVRRKESWAVGCLNGMVLGLVWLWAGVGDDTIAGHGWTVRLGLALCLSMGTVVATMGLSLIGRDLGSE